MIEVEKVKSLSAGIISSRSWATMEMLIKTELFAEIDNISAEMETETGVDRLKELHALYGLAYRAIMYALNFRIHELVGLLNYYSRNRSLLAGMYHELDRFLDIYGRVSLNHETMVADVFIDEDDSSATREVVDFSKVGIQTRQMLPSWLKNRM